MFLISIIPIDLKKALKESYDLYLIMNCNLSIVVPFYNEEKNVRNVVYALIKNLQKLDIEYEIILVNNGSKDSTLNIINSLIKNNKILKKVDLKKNKGYGNGILNGLRVARGNYVGFVDGDGQFGFDNLIKAYKKLEKSGLDFCKGVRVGREDGLIRNLLSISYTFFVNLLFFTDIEDINSKPKIMKRECYNKLNLNSKDWFIDSEIMLKIKKNGFKYDEIPLISKKRSEGKSSLGFGAIIQFLKNILVFRIKSFWKTKKPLVTKNE